MRRAGRGDDRWVMGRGWRGDHYRERIQDHRKSKKRARENASKRRDQRKRKKKRKTKM